VKGKLYLLPVTLGTKAFRHVIPDEVIKIICGLRHFIVEDIRSARRYLRLLDPSFPIDDSEFQVLNEHSSPGEISKLIDTVINGNDAGIMSEAGLPGIADPGSPLVMIAHRSGIEVKPLTGPSSIFLAIMASGLNGQSFTFNGYLPVKGPERTNSIRQLEKDASRGISQIFIETPYRNQKLFEEIIATCRPETRLCIAVDITAPSEYIKTLTIKEWANSTPDLSKRPAVFIIG